MVHGDVVAVRPEEPVGQVRSRVAASSYRFAFVVAATARWWGVHTVRMHDYLAEVDADPTQKRGWQDERLQKRSHGESFLTVLRRRFAELGVYFLDEPEAACRFAPASG